MEILQIKNVAWSIEMNRYDYKSNNLNIVIKTIILVKDYWTNFRKKWQRFMPTVWAAYVCKWMGFLVIFN